MFKKIWRIGFEMHAYDFDYVRYKFRCVAKMTEVYRYEDGKWRSLGCTSFVGSLDAILKEVS